MSDWRQVRVRSGVIASSIRVGLAALAVGLGLRCFIESLPRYWPKDWANAHLWDAMQDWLAARLYLNHVNPYSPEGLQFLQANAFGHPPTTPFWFLPLAGLSRAQAAIALDLSTWLAVGATFYLCGKELRVPLALPCALLLFGWSLTTQGMAQHWHLIQVSAHIGLLTTGSWMSLRRGRQELGGLCLGAAATLKLFPGVMILFLLLARQFRAFLVASATYAAIALVMMARFGWRAWPMFLTQQGPTADAWMASVRNASLHGIVLRAIFPSCEGLHAPTAATSRAALGLSLLLLGAAAALSVRTLRGVQAGDASAIDAPFSLFSVLAVFINPWIWEHYWVLLIQPAFVAMHAQARTLAEAWGTWGDGSIGIAALARRLTVPLLVFSFVALSAHAIALQRIWVQHVYESWQSHPSAWLHRQLHFYEVCNCLPWILLLLSCALTTWAAAPAASRAR